MRRVTLVIVILLVHCLALLSAAGTRNAFESLRAQRDPPAPATESQPGEAQQNGAASAPQVPPTTNSADSTYERYIQEREQAAATQAAAALDEPSSPFHLQLNLDFTNAYFYRGILQQDHGLIVQPAAKLTINVYKHDDLAIDAFLGTWNSFGSNSGTNTGDLISDWYECDLLAGFVITKDKFSLTTSYTFLTSPSDAYQTVQELDFTLGFDDSDLLGKFAMHPYALLGIETGSVGSDGADPGVYLELGVAPGFSFDLCKTPVAVTFPVALGLSLHDYYQDATGDDNMFGFVQAGAKASLPLPFGERFGQWTLNAGVAGLFLSDNLATINHDNNFEVIGTIGLQWNF